ncbi:hypothetical protein CB0940_05694 [Cercospora beticola]|uniref:Uncharacterized protein n=1 Tax=Cercospora beticola TaxID=122368 RepID=A0A2G5HYP7_CERBT|nr:hypothetical protein CB0940_05694 [Cercospora beticola]PIA97658.1 hypothetical protein CB0940_05694 [Cercospora beticola]WPA98269.1 hypothetical protein RHO25_002881 [Cercospora beticola]CAK1359497.1 unnamed protein product [Cercospora beticola]
MSLREAYTLAHTAQCRLQLAASRPDRNLRFVVGHLMHYESLRLRIVEIEHDISKSSRSSSVAFKGTGHVDHHLQHKPSTGQLGRRSPPPPAQTYDDDTDSDEDEDMAFDDEADDGLSLERFPSAAAQEPRQPPQPTRTDPEPPELEPDDEDYSDDEEPRSPEEPSPEDLQRAVKGEGNELYATYYEGVRKCVCHGNTDAPSFDRMWELPPDQSSAREGVTRAVAHVRDGPAEAQAVCTAAPLHTHHAQQEVVA